MFTTAVRRRATVAAICVGLILSSWIVLNDSTPGAEASATAHCQHPGRRLVTADRELAICARDSLRDAVFVCNRASGRRFALNDVVDGGGDALFARPAIAVAGDLVAFGHVLADTPDTPASFVWVARVSARSEVVIYRQQVFAGAFILPKVVAVKLARTGVVAWMTCLGTRLADFTLRGDSFCEGAGELIYIYKRDAGHRTPVLLAQGTTIDPRSLRLRAATLSWTQGGTTVEAVLR